MRRDGALKEAVQPSQRHGHRRDWTSSGLSVSMRVEEEEGLDATGVVEDEEPDESGGSCT